MDVYQPTKGAKLALDNYQRIPDSREDKVFLGLIQDKS
jgi:hypothetical protein